MPFYTVNPYNREIINLHRKHLKELLDLSIQQTREIENLINFRSPEFSFVDDLSPRSCTTDQTQRLNSEQIQFQTNISPPNCMRTRPSLLFGRTEPEVSEQKLFKLPLKKAQAGANLTFQNGQQNMVLLSRDSCSMNSPRMPSQSSPSSPKFWKCCFCQLSFITKTTYDEHMNHHKREKLPRACKTKISK